MIVLQLFFKFNFQLMDQSVEDYADNPPGLVHIFFGNSTKQFLIHVYLERPNICSIAATRREQERF